MIEHGWVATKIKKILKKVCANFFARMSWILNSQTDILLLVMQAVWIPIRVLMFINILLLATVHDLAFLL